MNCSPRNSPAGSPPPYTCRSSSWVLFVLLPMAAIEIKSSNSSGFWNPPDTVSDVFKTPLRASLWSFIFIALFNLCTALVLSVNWGQTQSWLENRFSLAQGTHKDWVWTHSTHKATKGEQEGPGGSLVPVPLPEETTPHSPVQKLIKHCLKTS